MKLKDYLFKYKIKKQDFAGVLKISRTTLRYYLRLPEKVPYVVKLAIEYMTAGDVKRDDW